MMFKNCENESGDLDEMLWSLSEMDNLTLFRVLSFEFYKMFLFFQYSSI